MNEQDLITKIKEAYTTLGYIPSRGCLNRNVTSEDAYACAAQVMDKLSAVMGGLVEWDNLGADWRQGFNIGFEWTNGRARLSEWVRGIEQGVAVAEAIFNWPESVTIGHLRIRELTKLEERVEFLLNEVKALKTQKANDGAT